MHPSPSFIRDPRTLRGAAEGAQGSVRRVLRRRRCGGRRTIRGKDGRRRCGDVGGDRRDGPG